MKEKYKARLERAFELEGLLLLAMSKDEVPAELEELIERKISELMEHETEPKEQAQPAQEPDTYYSLDEEEDEGNIAEETQEIEELVADPKERGKWPVFSLNDRFLYIRELFGGDTGEFNKALESVAGARNYREAEGILTQQYGLNPDGPDADVAFFRTIEKYFREK